MRFFNTAGPVRPDIHYCIPPLERWDLEAVLSLIKQQKYFVLHAPRQTGKTSCLLALVEYLNHQGELRTLYANVEAAQAAREDLVMGIRTIVESIAYGALSDLQDVEAEPLAGNIIASIGPATALTRFLAAWCTSSSKRTMLTLDEVDALVGDTLISLLRQLRSGYRNRPKSFPQSVILCGVRDVRDYRIHSSSEKSIITGGSAFNIRAESLRLGDFSREEMERLYAQHTEETGQLFQPEALDIAWDLSCGQPWVVNALAYETCFRMKEGRDRSLPITGSMIERAGENLILRRETHLDQLADKLKEPRVQRVIEPLLAGEDLGDQPGQDDIEYVIDLGLIRRGPSGLEISNGLYREVIPRQLTFMTQITLESVVPTAWYIRSNGSLDMEKLLGGFQQFFRENSEHWSKRFEYQEAWPQLLLQAYLQRGVNGRRQVHREYGLGRGRTDLLVVWKEQRFILELKVIRQSLEQTLAQGLEQIASYMDRQQMSEGHLILFDRTARKAWDEKVFRREEKIGGKRVTIWGM